MRRGRCTVKYRDDEGFVQEREFGDAGRVDVSDGAVMVEHETGVWAKPLRLVEEVDLVLDEEQPK